ncbi:hypothetical protein C8J56DRAFT_1049262 [Mycena floridula]|nr:hypothetical protein C8J56DRAFT_1049262 [Mycena floridula]
MEMHCVIVLAVDTIGFESPKISVACRRNALPQEPFAVALNAEMVAIVTGMNSVISILAINLLSGQELTISTDITALAEDHRVLVQFIDRELHMFVSSDESQAFYQISRQFFPYTDNPTPRRHLADDSRHLVGRPGQIQPIPGKEPIAVLFLDYKMQTSKIQINLFYIDFPPEIVYDNNSVMVYSPWNVMAIRLLDTSKEHLLPAAICEPRIRGTPIPGGTRRTGLCRL